VTVRRTGQYRWHNLSLGYIDVFNRAAAAVDVDVDVRARELARQKREMCQEFMRQDHARRLEEARQAHERQKVEDQRIAEVAREKALKDELFKAKKARDDDARQLVRQRVQIFLCFPAGFSRLLESWIFFLQNPRTWKVPENHFGPAKSWELNLKVRESPGKISLKVMHFSSGSNGKQAAIV